MEIREEHQEDKLILEVSGRVDTNTSMKLQDALLKGFQKYTDVVLNLENTEYVSSAGLRVFLIAEKTAKAKKGSFQLQNVSPDVMEVLQMTGFDNILDIQ